MRLITAHKILIGTAIAVGALLVPWSIWRWRSLGQSHYLVLGAAGGVLAVALTFYLRVILKKYRGKLG